MEFVKFTSLNVNGLRDESKRREIFKYLKNIDGAIVLLQETHSTKEQEHIWQAEWGNKIAFSHGTSASRGVATLANRKSSIKIKEVVRDTAGRWLITDLECDEEIISLVNVYGPNEDSAEFYINLFGVVEERGLENVIYAGDLNLTLNFAKDYLGPSEQDNHKRKREILQNYMAVKGIQDVWRNAHENDYVYTWRRNVSNSTTSRLDYFLVSDSLVPRVRSTFIAPRFKSDHNRIEMVMNLASNPRGKGYWKFNSLLLRDKEFLELMNKEIERFLMERNDYEDLCLKWESLKVHIQSISAEYAKSKAKARSRLIELFEHKLVKLEEKLINTVRNKDLVLQNRIAKDITRTQEFLADEHSEKTKAAMFRSKCQFYNEGEKNTKYFFGLEKARYNARARNQVNTGNGLITDPVKILREEAIFFQKLYKKGVEGDIKTLNESDVKLTNDQRDELDKELSIEELSRALKAMENSKTPGSDGLSADFYKVFWNRLKEPLFEALTQAISRKKLYDSALRGILTRCSMLIIKS